MVCLRTERPETMFSKKLLFLPATSICALAVVTAMGGNAVAAGSSAPAWTIQPTDRMLAFAVINNGSEQISGTFSSWGGEINFDPLTPATAAIRIEIELASASVGESYKDAILKGDEFLDAAVGPTADFESTSVEALPDGRYIAHGTLGLKGVRQPLDVEFRLDGDDSSKRVTGTALIERKPFNIGFGAYGGSLDKTIAVEFVFSARRR